jgi:hypothetical protein
VIKLINVSTFSIKSNEELMRSINSSVPIGRNSDESLYSYIQLCSRNCPKVGESVICNLVAEKVMKKLLVYTV